VTYLSATHSTVATADDDPDAEINKDQWNEPHAIDGEDELAEAIKDDLIDTLYPVGSIYVSTLSTNPGTLLGRGTWTAFAQGQVLVGHQSGDATFGTPGDSVGAKTVAAAGSISGVAISDHDSHTHTYTQVPNHVHANTAVLTVQGGTTANNAGTHVMTSTATGGSARAVTAGDSIAATNVNPTGGVASGTTAGPGSTLSHSVSSNGTFTGSATSVVQPSLVVYMWTRTA